MWRRFIRGSLNHSFGGPCQGSCEKDSILGTSFDGRFFFAKRDVVQNGLRVVPVPFRPRFCEDKHATGKLEYCKYFSINRNSAQRSEHYPDFRWKNFKFFGPNGRSAGANWRSVGRRELKQNDCNNFAASQSLVFPQQKSTWQSIDSHCSARGNWPLPSIDSERRRIVQEPCGEILGVD